MNSKPIKMLIENFPNSISRDKRILSPLLLFVTENKVKIRSFFMIFGLILFVMNLSNSRYVYSNLNLHFWHASLWRCTIHFNKICLHVILSFFLPSFSFSLSISNVQIYISLFFSLVFSISQSLFTFFISPSWYIFLSLLSIYIH